MSTQAEKDIQDKAQQIAVLEFALQQEKERQRLLNEASATLVSLLDHQFTLQEIARMVVPAFADYCRIVLLDEPTAALGVKQTEIVLSFIERLKSHGVGVIFISHNMPQVLRVADRIVVLRLGRKVFDGPRSELTSARLVAFMTGATPATVS